MVICNECGVENEIGRVFCSGCGVKLDLSAMTSDHVASLHKVPWYKELKYLKYLAIIPVIIVVIPIWMRMSPVTAPIGEMGNPVGRMRVIRALDTIKQVEAGELKDATLELSESDLNAFFRIGKAREMGYYSIRVDIVRGAVRIRALRPRRTFNLGGKRIEPLKSIDMICVASRGKLVPVKVKVGHLGAGRKAAMPLIRDITKQDEWQLLSGVSELTLENDKLTVVAGK